jgi:hypothetical protein
MKIVDSIVSGVSSLVHRKSKKNKEEEEDLWVRKKD